VIGEEVDPAQANFQRLEQYAAICRNIAGDTGAQLLDLRQAFIDYLRKQNSRSLSRGILTKDGVHMNDAGNRLIAQQVCDALGIPFAVKSNTFQSNTGISESSLHLYLLIGQSNMAGRAPIPDDAKGDIENCYLLNDQGEWSPASNPLNRYSSIRKDLEMQKLGPGYSFARTMLAQAPDVSLGLVVNAKGGSKIDSWQKGERFYEEALARVRIAQQSGTLKGILWHQGESNYEDQDYLPKLIQLIADLRADLNDKNLPFVVGQINGIKLINDQLSMLPESVPFTDCVSFDGLVAQDKWHFDSESQLELGIRYADAMQAVFAKNGSN